MAEWDLTSKMGPYLDRHLVFPLLEFLTVKNIYEDTDLDRGKLDLLSDTNMVDFAMDVFKRLYPGTTITYLGRLVFEHLGKLCYPTNSCGHV